LPDAPTNAGGIRKAKVPHTPRLVLQLGTAHTVFGYDAAGLHMVPPSFYVFD
jgi:hypothetical protein